MSDISRFSPIRALDRDGIPVSGALASFFLSGTTTPQVVYADQALTVEHPVPLVADANGVFPPVYSAVEIKGIVTDASGTVLPGYPIDPVARIAVGSGASQISFSPTAAVPATNVQAAIELLGAGITSKLIGEPFPIWDHIPGCPIPSNSGSVKFIRLTAGQSGLGEYNNGLLDNESTSGTAPAIIATAEILVGPMAGEVVELVNTEQAFIRPRTTSGVLQSAEIQSHSHTLSFSRMGSGGGRTEPNEVAETNGTSIGPQTYGTNATGGDETRPRNRSATFYMRVL